MNIKTLILFIFFSFSFISYSQIEGVKIRYVRNTDNSCDFYYEKSNPGTYHLIVKFEYLKNTPEYYYEGNIKENSGFLFQLKPIKPEKKIKFICEPYFIKGNPKPDIDKNFTYLLPFKVGRNIDISTITTMMDELNEGNMYFALLLNYSESKNPQTIHAMRKGIVVDVINIHEFNPNSFSVFDEKRNSIIIEHEDGTYALYSGFKKNSINVKIGQTVLPTAYLGILEKSVDNQYHLLFDIYYRSYMRDIFPDKKNDLNKLIPRRVNPLFYTNEGLVNLDGPIQEMQNYIVTTPEKIICQEFTEKELEERNKLLSNKISKNKASQTD